MHAVARHALMLGAAFLVHSETLAAQGPPEACLASPSRDSVRIALYITDQGGNPWEALGRVSVAGRSEALRAQIEVLRRPVARGWFCSRVLPVGDYNIEISSPGTFADTVITIGRSARGAAIRYVMLRPSEWRVGDPEDYARAPRMEFTYSEVNSSSVGRIVDSVVVRDSTVTIVGTIAFDIGVGLRAFLLNHEGHLVVDLVEVRDGDIILPAVLTYRFVAVVTGLGNAPYRLTVRDLPFGAFNAHRGFSAIVNMRNGQIRDSAYIGP